MRYDETSDFRKRVAKDIAALRGHDDSDGETFSEAALADGLLR